MLEDAIQLHRAGRLAEAEQGYRELLAASPDDAELLQLLGILRGQRGDLPEALQLVKRACALDPDNAARQYALGELHLREGALDEAAAAYDQARMLNPNLASAHSGLGQVALLRGDLAAGEEHFKVALRADENDVQAITGLGNIAGMRGDSERSLQWLTQAAELAPTDPLIQTSYAQAMLDQGMNDFAARAVDNALAVKPDYPLALAMRGELHLRKGETAEALAIFQALLARGEQVGAAHTGMGDIARLGGNLDAAIPEYDAALRVQPHLHPAAIRRADALARSGRVAQAIADLRRHIAAHPDGVRVYTALANLFAQGARHDDELAVWEAAEARWPDDVELKAQHALALDRAGRTREALDLAERAAASPRPAIAMLRARGALLAGDPAAAVQRLQRIDDSQFAGTPPNLPRRRQRLLGLAYDALEQWADAVQAFLAAPRKDLDLPNLPVLDEPDIAMLRQLAAEPALATAGDTPPVLLCGLPGSGVEQVATLLAEQPGCSVRRDRRGGAPDFVNAAFDGQLLQPLNQAALARLARGYRRALKRLDLPESTQVVDWVPLLDARVVPAVQRALPGVRLLLVQRDPDDELLNWLGFGWLQGFALSDPLAGARWLRLAATHLAAAAELLPSLRVDPDALLAPAGEAARAQLGAFLGIDPLVLGPAARASTTGRGGLPTSFANGHAAHYREALAEAFAVLDAGV
ncbi:MAG TPA: tetratricopeptide repeat protein [Rhodanobacteraceae bacterium]|nr:tetratricopeptide repeat protein [Rhodanobacteraceae bacterium]